MSIPWDQVVGISIGIVLWDLGKWAWRRHRERYQPRHRKQGREWNGGKAEAEYRRRGDR